MNKYTYNPCDECPYGIDMRDGSGSDNMCKICEFKQLLNSDQPTKQFRAGITDGIPLDHLEAICTAEKDGRLVVLPCKVGDTIFKKWSDHIEPYTIKSIEPNYFMKSDEGNRFISVGALTFEKSLGDNMFLAREAAD